jgi:hypothetical protein
MSTYEYVISIKVPFKKSRKEIKKWVKESLANNADYIPLYVDCKEVIEDCGKKTKVKVKHEKDHIGWAERQRSSWAEHS